MADDTEILKQISLKLESITRAISLRSLVQQVNASQKSMRQSATFLIAFTFLASILYINIPGISGVHLSDSLGASIIANDKAIRLIVAALLFYYVLVFGTNYYKGLDLIFGATKNINNESLELSSNSRDNFEVALSDNYLFDAMRRLIGTSEIHNSEPETENQDKRSDETEEHNNKKPDLITLAFDIVAVKIRELVAFIVVTFFILLVLYAELLVMLPITEIGTIANGNTIIISKTGTGLRFVVVVIFGILSFMFFSYLAKQFEAVKKFGLKKFMLALALLGLVGQPLLFFNLTGGENVITVLHQGGRIGDPIKKITKEEGVGKIEESMMEDSKLVR